VPVRRNPSFGVSSTSNPLGCSHLRSAAHQYSGSSATADVFDYGDGTAAQSVHMTHMQASGASNPNMRVLHPAFVSHNVRHRRTAVAGGSVPYGGAKHSMGKSTGSMV
jgi:hypothetical protein